MNALKWVMVLSALAASLALGAAAPARGDEHVVAGAADGSLLDFAYRPDTDWQVVDWSRPTGAKIAGPPTAAADLNWTEYVQYVAAGAEDGSLLVFTRGPGGFTQVVNVSEQTGQKIAGPPSALWLSGGYEHVAAGAEDGSLLVFYSKAATDSAKDGQE